MPAARALEGRSAEPAFDSGRECECPSVLSTRFVDRLHGMLKDSKAPPQRLKLELTESMLLDNVEDTVRKMQALSQLG